MLRAVNSKGQKRFKVQLMMRFYRRVAAVCMSLKHTHAEKLQRLLQKKPNEKAVTVSLHCNYSRENSVHYLRTNVRRVGRQKQKGPEPTPSITSQWRTRANLKDAGLTDWTCPSICYLPIQWTRSCAFCPLGSKEKGGVRRFPSWILYYSCNVIIISLLWYFAL